jgi:hypothetical protein
LGERLKALKTQWIQHDLRPDRAALLAMPPNPA